MGGNRCLERRARPWAAKNVVYAGQSGGRSAYAGALHGRTPLEALSPPKEERQGKHALPPKLPEAWAREGACNDSASSKKCFQEPARFRSCEYGTVRCASVGETTKWPISWWWRQVALGKACQLLSCCLQSLSHDVLPNTRWRWPLAIGCMPSTHRFCFQLNSLRHMRMVMSPPRRVAIQHCSLHTNTAKTQRLIAAGQAIMARCP